MPRRSLTFLAVLCLLALVAGGSASRVSAGTNDLPTLTVLEPAPLTDFMNVIVAYESGLFTKNGVNVKLVANSGANTVNMIATGQGDIADYTPASAAIFATAGHKVAAIWAREIINPTAVFAGPKIKSLADLKSVPNCRFATGTQGSSTYADAITYVREAGLKNCTVVPTSNQSVLVAGVLAGSYTAANGVWTLWLQAKQGGANILIDPTTAKYKKTYGRFAYLSGVEWGDAANLQRKRPAVVAFLRALRAANDLMAKETPAQLAAIVQKNDAFSTIPLTTLTQSIAQVIPHLGKNVTPNRQGYLSKQTWDQMLSKVSQWGINGFDPSNPAVQYSQMVDMSYFNAAAKKKPAWKFPSPPKGKNGKKAKLPKCWLAVLGCPKK